MTSLYNSVVSSINKRSPECATKFTQHYQPTPIEGDAIIHMNRYLRTQLGLLPVDTIRERECLMDNVGEKEWMRLFNKHVVQTIVTYGLPDWK